MEIEMHHCTKMAAVWLTRAERENPEIQEQLDQLYEDCKAKKYTVAVFHSGNQDLLQQTSGLLLYNRRRTAQRAGKEV